jgi:hypothetical protein
LWVAVEAGIGWLARNRLLLNLFLFKGLAAGLHLASAVLVYGALRHLAPGRSLLGMLFFAWNPLLLHELVGNAHNDAAVAMLALLGFYLLSPALALWQGRGSIGRGLDTPSGLEAPAGAGNRALAAIPSLTAAVLVKPVALLWLPLVAFWLVMQGETWSCRVRRLAVIAALVVLPSVAAYAPFWVGPSTFQGVATQRDIHGNSLPNLLIQFLWSLRPDARQDIVAGVALLTTLIFLPFYVRRLWKARTEPLRASYDVMLFYLLFVGLQFMPWYLAWLLVPAALVPDLWRRRLAVALCAMTPLLYFPFGWRWARHNLPVWGVALLASLPILALSLWLGARLVRTRGSR